MHRRHWEEAAERPNGDADRAYIAARMGYMRYVGDLASAWIEKGAAGWERSPPEWYTAAWRDALRARVHLLGEHGPRALALIRSDVDGGGEGLDC
jgi:hypothetical protein